MRTETIERLELVLEKKGWTQRKLAEKAGFTEESLSRWFNGKNKPYPRKVITLAKILGVDADWLSGEGDRLPIPWVITMLNPTIPTSTPSEPNPDVNTFAAATLNWVAVVHAARMVFSADEARGMSEPQLAGILKNAYLVATREPTRLTEDLVSGLFLAQI